VDIDLQVVRVLLGKSEIIKRRYSKKAYRVSVVKRMLPRACVRVDHTGDLDIHAAFFVASNIAVEKQQVRGTSLGVESRGNAAVRQASFFLVKTSTPGYCA
jgi:hypothetical protein